MALGAVAAAVLFGAVSAAPSSAGGPGAEPSAPSPIEQAYRAGKAAKGDEAAARAQYQRGIDLARAALARDPNAPDALLWLSANLAGEALTHGKMTALRVVPEVEATLLRLEKVNPDYHHAAAARGLANLYWRAPSLISVGSSAKAATYFDLILSRAPDYPGNQADAAAYFASEHDCGRARPLAQAVVARPDLDTLSPDGAEWRQKARDALRACE
jgi:hypothetical protein